MDPSLSDMKQPFEIQHQDPIKTLTSEIDKPENKISTSYLKDEISSDESDFDEQNLLLIDEKASVTERNIQRESDFSISKSQKQESKAGTVRQTFTRGGSR